MSKEKTWENIGYINLALCIFGQVAIGWLFIPAQLAYLTGDCIMVVRDFILKRPIADKVRDIAFTVICIGVIVVKIYGG